MNKRIVVSAIAGLGLAGCCFGGATGGGGAGFTIAPGFAPDPMTATGSAGGIVEAATLSPDCRGYVSMTPNHVITASAAFAELVVAVNGGSADLTLVVQHPDGTYQCNDDSDGFNPSVHGPFAAGEHRVFIGSYNAQSAGAAYRIGISANPATTPTLVGMP